MVKIIIYCKLCNKKFKDKKSGFKAISRLNMHMSHCPNVKRVNIEKDRCVECGHRRGNHGTFDSKCYVSKNIKGCVYMCACEGFEEKKLTWIQKKNI